MQDPQIDRTHLFVNIYVLAVAVVVILLAFLMRSTDETTVTYPGTSIAMPEICTTRRVIGIDCPGCGLTRSFIHLARGDIRTSIHFHPVGFAVFLVVAFQIPFRSWQISRILKGGQPAILPRWEFVWYGIAIAIFLFWIVKMCGTFLFV